MMYTVTSKFFLHAKYNVRRHKQNAFVLWKVHSNVESPVKMVSVTDIMIGLLMLRTYRLFASLAEFYCCSAAETSPVFISINIIIFIIILFVFHYGLCTQAATCLVRVIILSRHLYRPMIRYLVSSERLNLLLVSFEVTHLKRTKQVRRFSSGP